MIPLATWESLREPINFGKLVWPEVGFYDKQREAIRSVRDNIETVVPAGNQLG